MTAREIDQPGLSLAARIRTADGMFAVDKDLRITFWNDEASRILGVDRETVVGKKCYEVLCDTGKTGRGSCNRDCRVVTNARRGRPTRDFDLACSTADGDRRWLNISVIFERPLGQDGELVHLFRDVTESRSVGRAVGVPPELGQRDRRSLPGTVPALSRREDQVLRLLAAGKTTGEVAEALGVKPVSARNHITRLTNKFGASTMLQAVSIGMRAGLV